MWTINCYLFINLLILIKCNNYNDYIVISVVPRNELEIDFINNLTDSKQAEYWFSSATLNQPVKLLLKSDNQQSVLIKLLERKVIPNYVGKLISEHQRTVNEKNETINGDNLFRSYHRLYGIENYLRNLVTRFPEKVIVSSFGKSFEKRNLTLVRISESLISHKNATRRRNRSKPVIYIQGGIHAREWISPATVIYLVNYFTQFSDSDPTIKRLLNYFEFWFVPIVNPDGYEYTHTHDRFWRKTRSVINENDPCVGVDPNRNFDFYWGVVGISDDPCSEIYPGPKPNSEPEVAAIVNLISPNAKRIKAFLDFHSYNQSWLIPFGFSSQKSKDFADLERIAKKSTNALALIHGTKYSVGNKAKLLYSASGIADDWAKGVAKIKYSFTIELSDKGEFGFLLPPDRIIPVGQEITEAIKVFSLELMKEINQRRVNRKKIKNNQHH